MEKRIAAKRKIQELMHYHGVEEFLKMTYEAMQDAADDTEQFEDKRVSANYVHRAMQLDLMIDEKADDEVLKQIIQECIS